MDGYATLDAQQFKTALETAIATGRRTLEVINKTIQVNDEEWALRKFARRNFVFGPWSMEGARRRVAAYASETWYHDRDRVRRYHLMNFINDWETQLRAVDGHINGEPFLIKMEDFRLLMKYN